MSSRSKTAALGGCAAPDSVQQLAATSKTRPNRIDIIVPRILPRQAVTIHGDRWSADSLPKSERSMGLINRLVRCLMRLAFAPSAVLCAVTCPVMAQTPAAQEVRIGLLARKVPPPPTFSFDAVPQDEGFAGARVAIKDNDTTGVFTGQRYVLDEVSLEADESPVTAARKLVEGGTGL